jgi:glutamyl-tRNA synthetase
MENKNRVRFAPSPTGSMHIGNVRNALYDFLFAKKNNGEFLLRIEDTDQDRYAPGSIEQIYEVLKWLGLDWHGEPIIQSTRLELYKKNAEELVKNGHAYYCFCSKERLEEVRKDQEAKKLPSCYDRHCRNLSEEEIANNLESRTPFVIRLKVPESGIIEFEDVIKGKVSFDLKTIDDQVLLKSDGFPTYHLASVTDDNEMKISHVIRSEEWLPSTPKHLLLYKFFGWEPPRFVHLPMILGSDKSKLSKRHGATSVAEFKEQGYLPEALINFIAFLGWNPGDEREIFSLDELVDAFSLDKVHKAPAVFNMEKLDWLNGHYIRQKSLDELARLCLPYLEKAKLIKPTGEDYNLIDNNETVNLDYIKSAIALEQERMKKLSEVADLTKFFFQNELDYPAELLIWKKSNLEEAAVNLKALNEFLSGLTEANFTKEILETKVKQFIQTEQKGIGDFLWPLRVALTGEKASPGPFEVAHVLGQEKTLKRINDAINKIKKNA